MLAVPSGKLGNWLCHLKNSPFLWKSVAQPAQDIAQSKACHEDPGLSGASEGLRGKTPELCCSIVGKTTFKLDPSRMKGVLPVVLNEGKGGAIRRAGFG